MESDVGLRFQVQAQGPARAGVQGNFPYLTPFARAHPDAPRARSDFAVGDHQPGGLAHLQAGFEQQLEPGVVPSRLAVAGLASGPQQRLNFSGLKAFRLQAHWPSQKSKRGGGIRADHFLLLGLGEEFLQRLDFAVGARCSQLFRPDEVLAVIDQIDGVEPASRARAPRVSSIQRPNRLRSPA